MKLYVISPIVNAIMGFIGNRFGGFGIQQQTPAPIVNRSFASGGTVQARRPIMVGERGAEIFVPNTGGKIMNNHQANSAMKGGEITVNQNLNFTTGIQNTVRAEVLNMLPDIVEASKSGVLDAVQRVVLIRERLHNECAYLSFNNANESCVYEYYVFFTKAGWN